MFTGIVTEMGTVLGLERRPGGATLRLEAGGALRGLRPGGSLAVNGACLTVTQIDGRTVSLDLMPETLRRSNLGQLKPGQQVHLEPPLRAGDPLGGHFVQGHVDGIGRLVGRTKEGEAVLLTVEAPVELAPYIVPKGFVAVDGVSLTVVERRGETFSVSLVRATQERTMLARRPLGARLNLEADILGKYVASLLGERLGEIPNLAEAAGPAAGQTEAASQAASRSARQLAPDAQPAEDAR